MAYATGLLSADSPLIIRAKNRGVDHAILMTYELATLFKHRLHQVTEVESHGVKITLTQNSEQIDTEHIGYQSDAVKSPVFRKNWADTESDEECQVSESQRSKYPLGWQEV